MNTTYTTTATGEAREAIVDKLHGALAAFRRERDELHRKKELAVERLQLVKEEQQAIEKTVHAMQEKLNQLNKSGSEEAKKDLEQMEKDMDQVHRTVQFQHTELLAKRNKFEHLKTQMIDGAQVREASIRAAKDALKTRNDKMTNRKKQKHLYSCTTFSQQVDRFKQALQHEIDIEHLVSKCPLLIEQNAAAISMNACDIHRETESLSRILAGYQQRFGEFPGGTEAYIATGSSIGIHAVLS